MPAPDPNLDGVCSIRIPDHELLRLIGRGSYGEVWLARNIMGSYRAVKIIRRDLFDSDSPFDREFGGIKKFEPISRTHSGFVDILQIGRNDAERCLYYVMEAADDIELGQSIDPDRYVPRTLGKALARVKRFSVEQCVQMGLALCQALDTLHRHGLVHRDIKPSNIVFINGVPKLADIGLVTESNNARSFVGTEGFIPPEGPGSERADIYSLGKALYEIASGRDRLDFPALPADLPDFPDGEQFLELNECLIRACRLDPQKRYGSAREMYEDLALLASGKSLRRLRLLERRWENAKHTAAVLAGVVIVLGMIAWPIARERQHADEIRERQIGVRSANGITKMDQGDLSGALLEFSEVFRLQADDQRHFAVNQTRVASILANNPKLTEMFFLKGFLSTVELSADGRRLLAVEDGRRVRLVDVASGSDLLPPIESRLGMQAHYDQSGDLAIVAEQTGSATIWNLKTGEKTPLEHPSNVMSAKFSPSGRLIATACKDGVTRLWSAESLKPIFEMRGHTASMRSVAFSPDERLLVSAGTDNTVRVWDVQTGQPVGAPMQHPGWVVDAEFSPDGTSIVTACQDGWARIWKVGSNQELPTLMKHDDVLTCASYSPDGTMILTASNDATVRLWNAKTTAPMARNHVLRHSAGVFTASFRPDGHEIITGCVDGSVRVWDLAGSELEPELVKGVVNDSGTMSACITPNAICVDNLSGASSGSISHPIDGDIQAVALSGNGNSLAALVAKASAKSSEIYVWQPVGSDLHNEIAAPEGLVTDLEFSTDGSLLSITVSNRVITTHIFDAASGAEWPLPDSKKQNAVIAFHPQKKALAIGNGTSVDLYENMSENPAFPEISIEGDVHHLAFSADGQRLLVCQSDSTVNPKSALIIDVAKGQVTGPEFWHHDGVLHGAFSGDGLRLITGGEDRELLVWNASTAAELLAPLHHHQQVRGVAFSPDARRIGSISSDAIVRVWDSETGFPLTPPLGCERNQKKIIFLPDPLRFATIQNPTRAWLWTLPRTSLSPEDAVAVSHLLNADLRSPGPNDTRQIAESWSRLKREFPELFRADEKQIASWHQKQYRLGESMKLKAAMAFHRERLDALEMGSRASDAVPARLPQAAFAKTSN